MTRNCFRGGQGQKGKIGCQPSASKSNTASIMPIYHEEKQGVKEGMVLVGKEDVRR